MPQPITRNSVNDDLSTRFVGSSTVQGSPIAAAAETIIATVNVPNFGDTAIVAGNRLQGWAAFTAGTNAVSATLRIRKTDVNGTVVASTGAVTVVAANLYAIDVLGADSAPGVGTYVLTLTMGSSSGNTTISAVHLSLSMF
jgi:hypothetical protein